MQQHNLGPNGAIMTSLNLYATKFDQVIRILEDRADNNTLSDYLLVDTPGQIEAFTWYVSRSYVPRFTIMCRTTFLHFDFLCIVILVGPHQDPY